VVIEAKLTEDDGTARDKVTGVRHLAVLSARGMPAGTADLDFVPCIAHRAEQGGLIGSS
jgi:hypothetical protein